MERSRDSKNKRESKGIHELVFVEGKGWGVRRHGSDKVIKYFQTKDEGTEYILAVSKAQSTSVAIVLRSGKIQ